MNALMLAPLLLVQSLGTTEYVVLNHGRNTGTMTVTRTADSTLVQYRSFDRGEQTWLHSRHRFATDGRQLFAEYTQTFANNRRVIERFETSGDSVFWRNGEGQAAAVLDERRFYRPSVGTPFSETLLARFLLGQPGRSARLWPRGNARLEIIADTVIHTSTGSARARLVMLFVGAPRASGFWLDDRNELIATEAAWFITVRKGAESALPLFRAIEIAYRNSQAEALAREVTRPTSGTIVVRNGDVFDSEAGVVRPRMTVIVRGERIVAVGRADSLPVPGDATVIDATGKTVIPGMWDMHGHTHLTNQNGESLLQLALGITTVRDLAADVDVAVSHRNRAATGALASPRLILAGFLEGPGMMAGPTDAIVSSEAEALAWIARYDSLGYRQIKLYFLLSENVVKAAVAEAHRRGLRVSGHVPRPLQVPAAVRLGVDELQHFDELLFALVPDSMRIPPPRNLVAVERGLFDADGNAASRQIALFREYGTVLDLTLNLTLSKWGARPPSVWDATISRYVKRLHDSGVRLVAGSDGTPARYPVELQLYERAGITAANVLQMATIDPARVMNDERDYGSIVPGKVADLVIVAGRPAERIADLANVEVTIRGGRLYYASELRSAVDRR